MKTKAKLDWDTVELVVAAPFASAQIVPDPRGKMIVKQILSGAAQKARTRGASYTHSQLRTLLAAGFDTLIYGWGLAVAAMEGHDDLSRGIETAARVIREASHRAPPR